MLTAKDAARALGPGHPVPTTPHGYVGLRIGKERARRVSDAGMTYDGLYAHYVDKCVTTNPSTPSIQSHPIADPTNSSPQTQTHDRWMFALLRFGQTCGHLGDVAAAERYLSQAEQLVQAVHPFFMQHDRRGEPVGLYWKASLFCFGWCLHFVFAAGTSGWPNPNVRITINCSPTQLNADMSPILGLEHTGPNDDALAWWVVYSLIRHARVNKAGGTRVHAECHLSCCRRRRRRRHDHTASLTGVATPHTQQQDGAARRSSGSGRRWTGWRAPACGAACGCRRTRWALDCLRGNHSGWAAGPRPSARASRRVTHDPPSHHGCYWQ
jgi:hypothetical protein